MWRDDLDNEGSVVYLASGLEPENVDLAAGMSRQGIKPHLVFVSFNELV